MNDINQQFDKLIDEICGPMVGIKPKPKHQTYDYIRRDKFREYEEWEHSHRKLERETVVSIHACNSCGCSFEIYTEPIPLIQYQNYDRTHPSMTIEHEDFYCIKCGMMFRVTGKVKYIKNKFRR